MNDSIQWVLIVALVAVQFLMLRRMGQLEASQEGGGMSDVGPPVGEVLPPFGFTSPEGSGLRRDDLQGEQNLLMFVSETCSYCREFLSSLSSIAENIQETNLILLDVMYEELMDKNYLDQYGFEGNIVHIDSKGLNELEGIGINATPSFVLVSPSLEVEAAGLCGSRDWDQALTLAV